jgi:hypothetical protein
VPFKRNLHRYAMDILLLTVICCVAAQIDVAGLYN